MSQDSRYEPLDGQPWGVCNKCHVEFETRDLARDHMNATLEEAIAEGGSAGHSVRITNATREERIANHVDDVVQDAIEGLVGELFELTDDGSVSEDEVRRALRGYSEVADEWDKQIVEALGHD